MKKLLLPVLLMLFAASWFSCDDGATESYTSEGTGGSMTRFACKGDYLYVVDPTYLQTFDISDSSGIVLKSRLEVTDWTVETIFVTDTKLFLGTTQGMYIYSLNKPDRPSYVALYQHIVSCDPVVVQGDYAYVTMHDDPESWFCNQGLNQLEVLDISNAANPVSKGVYPMIKPLGLGVDGSLLFVCDGMDIAVMDNSNPLALSLIKRIELDSTPYDLIAKDSLLIVTCADGVHQYSYAGDTLNLLSTLY